MATKETSKSKTAKTKNVINSQGKATAKDFRPGAIPETKTTKSKVDPFEIKTTTKTASPLLSAKASGKGLGKGLDALLVKKIPAETEEKENVSRGTFTLNINLIDPNPNQPRKSFNEDALQELASSIKEHGLIQPIVVQQSGDRYIIVAGERRWRASRLAGLKEIPVHIREFTPQQLFEAALIENIQRQDLNPIEEAEAYNVLIKEYHLKQDEVAERVSKSRVAITNSLRLLNLEKRVRELVVEGIISGGHARALLAIKDPDVQFRTAQRVLDDNLSVRDTEKLVKKLDAKASTVKPAPLVRNISEIELKSLEEKLKRILGTKVSINQKDGKKGSIVIEYYSPDELDRLYDLIKTVSLDR